MTKRNGTKVSLKSILGNSFDEFIEKFVYCPIEEWARQGRIDLITLKRLNRLVKKHGKDVFDIPAEQLAYVTRHTLEEGELLRVRLPITQDLVIDDFVKKFSGYEAYKKTLDIEKRVSEHLKDTGLADLIVSPLFTNGKGFLVSYPFINADSLADTLPFMEEDKKEETLKKIIDEYNRLSHELTENKNIFAAKSMLGKLMPYEECLDKFFFDRLGTNKSLENAIKLRRLFSKYFGMLSRQTNEVIHGDLNPGNIILQDDSVKIIDLEEMSFGFTEFDYGKLLTKSAVSEDLEERLVKYAAQNKAKIKGETASEQDVEDSYKKYALNRIAQELFTAVRYVKRSKEKDDSESLFNMALVSYNLALRRIDSAIERGHVGGDFKDSLEAFIKLHGQGLHDLGDKFDEYLANYNPYLKGSQENVVSAPSLDLILKGKPSQEEMDAELNRLKKSLRRKDWKKIGVKCATYALPFVLLAGAAISAFGVGYYNSEIDKITQDLNTQKKTKTIVTYLSGKEYSADYFNICLLRYAEKKFSDRRIACMFLLNPALTYEAMQETNSVDFNKIKNYIRQKDTLLWLEYKDAVDGSGIIDRWMREAGPEYAREKFDSMMEQAEKEYEFKKGLKTLDKLPNPALRK